MGASRISQRVQAEKEADKLAQLGIDELDAEFIRARQAIDSQHAQALADKVTIPKAPGRKWIIQEIQVDPHNKLRRMVELTPSMCKERNCGFDAAKEIGYMAGWTIVPSEQMLPSGKRLGEAILELLSHHITTAHSAIDTHILSDEEAERMGGWQPMPGQDPFLSAATS